MSALFGLIRNLGHKAINAGFNAINKNEKEQSSPKKQFKPKQPKQPTAEDKIKKIMGVD